MTLDSTLSGSGVRFLRNYIKKKRPRADQKATTGQIWKPQTNASSFNCLPMPFPPPKPRASETVWRPEADDDEDDGQSMGSTIAELLNESFDSDSDSELKYLDWDEDGEDHHAEDNELVDGEDGLSYAEYEDILRGIRRWIEAAKEKEEGEDAEEGKTLIVGDLSPTATVDFLEEPKNLEDEEKGLKRDRYSSNKLPADPPMSGIMKEKSRNSSAHSATQIPPPSRNSAAGNAFSTNASPQELDARAPLLLTPPGQSDLARQTLSIQTKPLCVQDPPREPSDIKDLSGMSLFSMDSPLVDSGEAEFKVRPAFGDDWPSSLTSPPDGAGSNLDEVLGSKLKIRDSDHPSSSAAASLPGECRRTNQSLADFWEERVAYKRSVSDGDKPAALSAARSGFRPFNLSYYYHPESPRKLSLFRSLASKVIQFSLSPQQEN